MKIGKWLKPVVTIISILVLLVFLFIFYTVKTNPKVALKQIEIESTPEMVAHGDYLANHVMACMDCHSERDWSRFSGPVKPGTEGKGGEIFDHNMGYPGKYIAPNITPFHLKDWSDAEIYRAITSGVAKDNRPLYPVMPYHSYGKLDDEDIFAVIAYLRTLKSIDYEAEPSKSDFPMNIQINFIPKEGIPTKRPPKTDLKSYGEYLALAAGCIDCHTPMEKGRSVTDLHLAGGREFKMPFGMLRSPNLTPHATGLHGWTEKQFIGKFKRYGSDIYQPSEVKPTQYNTIMPWTKYANMDSLDLKAIFSYLRSVEPIDNRVVKYENAAY